MKNKDLLLLSHLRANSRETLTKISRNTRIPVSTIFDRLKQTENTLITKHTTLVDFQQIGYGTRAKITLKAWKSDRDKLKDFLARHPNINSLYKINNGYDYLAEAIFKNIKDLEDFLETLEENYKLKSRQVYYIIEDIKREAFLSDPASVELFNLTEIA